MPTTTRKVPKKVIRIYRVACDLPLPTKAAIRAMIAALLAGDVRVLRPLFYDILVNLASLTPGDTATLENCSRVPVPAASSRRLVSHTAATTPSAIITP